MGPESSAALTTEERRTLRFVADTLVPALAVRTASFIHERVAHGRMT